MRNENRRVRFPWQPAEYSRTCEECGYTWLVPRKAARKRIRPINMFSAAPGGTRVDRGELSRQVASISMEIRTADVLRHCPKCGAAHFTQHRSRVTWG